VNAVTKLTPQFFHNTRWPVQHLTSSRHVCCVACLWTNYRAGCRWFHTFVHFCLCRFSVVQKRMVKLFLEVHSFPSLSAFQRRFLSMWPFVKQLKCSLFVQPRLLRSIVRHFFESRTNKWFFAQHGHLLPLSFVAFCFFLKTLMQQHRL